MQYQDIPWTMKPIKACEYCADKYEVTNIRKASRLCPTCDFNKADIDAIRNDTPYAQMTQEMKKRVADRAEERGTRGNGSFFDIKAAERAVGRAG